MKLLRSAVTTEESKQSEEANSEQDKMIEQYEQRIAKSIA
jgi:hypothetical protein